jgi:hypothetical protein
MYKDLFHKSLSLSLSLYSELYLILKYNFERDAGITSKGFRER